MNDKRCDSCGSELIKFGSDVFCSNYDCHNVISVEKDVIYIKYEDYKDVSNLNFDNVSNEISDRYVEDYDDFLYFSDRPDYISRFEYRKRNDFIEDKIFKGNKIDVSKRYLNRSEIHNFDDISEKYDLLVEGRILEKKSHKQALEFYEGLLNHRLFKNDYYIHKKLVIYEKNLEKQLDRIVAFFKSGIYCNRYHYLLFLKRLHVLSNKIDISNHVIDDCLRKFKEYGFEKKDQQDVPIPISEKIKLDHGVLKVKTDEEYALMQFEYERIEEALNLAKKNQLEYSNSIIESLIWDNGFKNVRLFDYLIRNYHTLGDYENELKWIFGFFSKGNIFNKNNFWHFIEKLDKLNLKTNVFLHDELFFDKNDYYLTKQDFKDNPIFYWDFDQYVRLIQQKYSMIKKGKKLERTNPYDAIDYYWSIINHPLFKNDYYVYKVLADIYHQIDFLEDELETILSFLNSGIYCDYYNYLFFTFNLKKLSQIFIVEDNEINGALKSFKEKSFKNKSLENNPAPLSDRIIFRNNELKVIPYEKFKIQQDSNSMELKWDLFESCGMYSRINEMLKTMIEDSDFNDVELYKEICHICREINDVEGELDIINSYLENDGGWNFQERKWFENRLKELENTKTHSKIIEDPQIEIFFEDNENFLNYDDFKNNEGELTELIDKLYFKYRFRQKGWKLENTDYKDAIEYYNSLINHYLFKDDYYIYRKLVIFYEKINDFEMMWQTIRSFFNSGINCSRYQYIWFLHKLDNVSKFMFISDEEVNECLKNFKENGFKNGNIESDVLLCERLYGYYSNLKIVSSDFYHKTQKKYEMKEQATQLQLNGDEKEAVKILRYMVDNGCNNSKKDYMRLCFMYRRLGEYENEREVINMYLSNPHRSSRDWFKKRLEYIENFIY